MPFSVSNKNQKYKQILCLAIFIAVSRLAVSTAGVVALFVLATRGRDNERSLNIPIFLPRFCFTTGAEHPKGWSLQRFEYES